MIVLSKFYSHIHENIVTKLVTMINLDFIFEIYHRKKMASSYVVIR